MPKDDGTQLEMRKHLTAVRAKLRIVQKKIKKYGDLGKIPMGASMRVYQENSESSSSDTSSDEAEDNVSQTISEDSDVIRAKGNKKKSKKKETLLATGLVYQPIFDRVVKDSTTALN